jgi:hypothetical protein
MGNINRRIVVQVSPGMNTNPKNLLGKITKAKKRAGSMAQVVECCLPRVRPCIAKTKN